MKVPRVLTLFATIAVGLAMGNAPVAYGDGVKPYDYYGYAPPHLLHNVNKYHLRQAMEKLKHPPLKYAEGDIKFMLGWFPNHPLALNLMGRLAIKEHRPEKAIKYFKRAIKMYPTRAPTYEVYGIFLYRIKRYDEAIKQYKKSLSLQPKSSETAYNLGLTYFAKGAYQKANKYAQQAYREGYPLPGLREKLKEKGAWKKLAEKESPQK